MYKVAMATFTNNKISENDDFSVLNQYILENNIPISLEQSVWNNSKVQWSQYDLIMIDSTWDYHFHADDFSKWLENLKTLDVIVLNPINLMRWNMSKSYLFDLYEKRFRIPQSLIISKGKAANDAIDLINLNFDMTKHSKLIIKPEISASSYKTAKIEFPINREGSNLVKEILESQNMLVQEYVQYIENGEYSLIFISGQFTHCMIKIPKENEFRSQEEFGSKVTKVDPPPILVDFADRLLDELPEYPTYARVDVVFDGVSGLLMECELIEPFLYLFQSKKAITRLIETFLNRLKN